MTDAPRTLGVATEYEHQVAIARARMAELGVTFEQLDALSGVQSGYSAKVLGPKPSKRFGPVSFGPIFGALGIIWLASHDQATIERLKKRADNIAAKRVTARSLRIQLQNQEAIEIFRALGRLGAEATNRRLTKAKRRANASHAARSQWRQRKWWAKRSASQPAPKAI